MKKMKVKSAMNKPTRKGDIFHNEGVLSTFILSIILTLLFATSVFGGEVHIVKIRDFNYHPHDLIIQEGDTVLWINEMPYGHWVISGADMRHDNRYFSPLLLKGHKFSHTFEEAVVQDYYCPIHSMQGRVTVLKKEKEEEKKPAKKKKRRRRRARE